MGLGHASGLAWECLGEPTNMDAFIIETLLTPPGTDTVAAFSFLECSVTILDRF